MTTTPIWRPSPRSRRLVLKIGAFDSQSPLCWRPNFQQRKMEPSMARSHTSPTLCASGRFGVDANRLRRHSSCFFRAKRDSACLPASTRCPPHLHPRKRTKKNPPIPPPSFALASRIVNECGHLTGPAANHHASSNALLFCPRCPTTRLATLQHLVMLTYSTKKQRLCSGFSP